MLKEKFDVDFTLVDMTDMEKTKQAIQSRTKVIYLETPINPTLKIVDLKAISFIAKENQITTVVDNTFMSPYFQRPLELGCDVVLHSATKYIGGHGDTIAGVVYGRKDFIDMIRKSP